MYYFLVQFPKGSLCVLEEEDIISEDSNIGKWFWIACNFITKSCFTSLTFLGLTIYLQASYSTSGIDKSPIAVSNTPYMCMYACLGPGKALNLRMKCTVSYELSANFSLLHVCNYNLVGYTVAFGSEKNLNSVNKVEELFVLMKLSTESLRVANWTKQIFYQQ